MALKNTKMLYEDCMFFVCNIIETLWCYKWTLLNSLEIFLVKLQFSGKSQCFYGSPYGIKEHKNDEMFLSKLFLKHASPIRCVLYILLDTFVNWRFRSVFQYSTHLVYSQTKLTVGERIISQRIIIYCAQTFTLVLEHETHKQINR